MFRYGKTAQTAITIMSRLAEVYDGSGTRLSAAGIAAKRKLPHPIVAKTLTLLSTANLVKGAPGPGGETGAGRSSFFSGGDPAGHSFHLDSFAAEVISAGNSTLPPLTRSIHRSRLF